jgi:hypothetical protein
LADRLNEDMNIAQAEIHKSYYRYTIVVDLEQIGIDEIYELEISNEEILDDIVEALECDRLEDFNDAISTIKSIGNVEIASAEKDYDYNVNGIEIDKKN